MGAIASQITSLTIVFSTVYSDADQRRLQCSASLAFVRGIHRGPVNSPHKWPATRKMLPFDGVIMRTKTKRPKTITTTFGATSFRKDKVGIIATLGFQRKLRITCLCVYPFIDYGPVRIVGPIMRSGLWWYMYNACVSEVYHSWFRK